MFIFNKKFLLLGMSSFIMLLTACVTVKEPKPVVVSGYATYLERMAVPQGSTINISVIDINTPGLILSQKNFNVAKVPVPFKFIFPADVIDKDAKYAVVAMIAANDKVLFQTYDTVEVINNDKFIAEVVMKRAR